MEWTGESRVQETRPEKERNPFETGNPLQRRRLGQATRQEAWGGENRKGISTTKAGIWKTNREEMVRMKSEAECAALQDRKKGKELHTALSYSSVFKLSGQSLYHVCG